MIEIIYIFKNETRVFNTKVNNIFLLFSNPFLCLKNFANCRFFSHLAAIFYTRKIIYDLGVYVMKMCT